MRKKILSFGIFLTLVGTNSGTAAPVTQLDEVVVTANRIEEKGTMPGGFVRQNTNLGLSGEKDIMDVPYTAQSLSQKSIAVMVMPTRQIDQALANVPSIRTGTSPIKTDFSIRGIGANGASLYLNNIPGFFIMCAGPEPNTIDHADVVIGPAATLSGSVQSYNGPDGGQPGSIYLYTKNLRKPTFPAIHRPSADMAIGANISTSAETIWAVINHGASECTDNMTAADCLPSAAPVPRRETCLSIFLMKQRGTKPIFSAVTMTTVFMAENEDFPF